jgi:hypothetical protein
MPIPSWRRTPRGRESCERAQGRAAETQGPLPVDRLHGTTLSSLEEAPLDAQYVAVKTEWRWEFDRPDRSELTLPSTFILFAGGGSPKIVFYLTHWDINKILQEHGWVAPSAP